MNQVVSNQFFNPFLLQGQIEDFLEVYNAGTDYLLLSGDPVIIGIVIHAAFTTSDSVQILKYEKRLRAYTDIEIKDPISEI